MLAWCWLLCYCLGMSSIATRTEKRYVCVLPSRPGIDPFYTNPRFKGQPIPECNTGFDTKAERRAHYLEAHPEYINGLNDRMRAALFDDRYYSDPAAFNAEFPRLLTDDITDYSDLGDLSDLNDDPIEGGGGEPTSRHHDSAASPEQLNYIASLAAQKGVAVPEVTTKTEATIAIDELKVLPDKGLRPNKFPGPCSECGVEVPAGEGFIRKFDGRWLTGHIGGCPEAKPILKVADGYYAVDSNEGHTSFYKVTAGRKPGVVFVDLCIGGGPNGGFQRQSVPWKQRQTIIEKILADGPDVAGKRFFEEASCCRRCGRGLTKEKSRRDGYGSECVKMVDG